MGHVLLAGALLLLHVASLAQTTSPDIFLYLDWRMSSGATSRLSCAETWKPPCEGSPPVYWQWEDTFDTGVGKVKRDYLPSGGYTKNLGDFDQNVQTCGPASFVEYRPQYVTWCCPSTPWIAQVTLRHSCTLRDRWGRASGPFNVENYVIFNGYCETGYQPSSDYRQCTRRDGWCAKYPENRGFGCGKTVADLEAVTKAADDPTRIFHQTQTCIARKSCDLRCQMDNCKWMDRVIPDFVNPYLQKLGRWPEIEADCRRGTGTQESWATRIRERLCARNMARYHIEEDLSRALEVTGCGTDRDWQAVFGAITSCTSETFQGLGPIPFSETIAQWQVRQYRDNVRAACQALRSGRSQPLDINSGLGGKVCDLGN
jgi:hypothetical protein